MFKKEYLHPNEGFSQVVVVETDTTKTLHISGQIGEGNDLESQTIATFKNLETLLKQCNSSFEDVVKTTIFIMDMNDFAKINAVYGKYFDEKTAPARETVQVACLPKNVNVEISMIAIK